MCYPSSNTPFAQYAGEECTDELNDLQTILGKQLNSWCPFVINW